MDFEEGQMVDFDLGSVKGRGFIRGKAMAEQPLIGTTWIVEVERLEPSIPNKKYPYTCVAVPGCLITPVGA